MPRRACSMSLQRKTTPLCAVGAFDLSCIRSHRLVEEGKSPGRTAWRIPLMTVPGQTCFGSPSSSNERPQRCRCQQCFWEWGY